MARGMGGKSPSNVAQHLKGIDFPADKRQIVECAKKNGADPEVVEVIQQMPDAQYEDMAGIMKGYGEVR